ncbi:hypothetical protein LLH03_09815 [bacterium]|nr:hypothetical protein [bacterium]
MKDSQPKLAYVALRGPSRERTLYARVQEGACREWRLPDRGHDLDKTLRELIRHCDDAPIVCFEAEDLSELLSRPEVLPHARTALAKLRDLRELALIWLPTVSCHSPEDMAAADTPGDDPLALTCLLWERVLEAIQNAPEGLLRVLSPLLAQDPGHAWLPWPEGVAGSTDLMRIGSVLPQKPPVRKRDSADTVPSGDLRDLSIEVLSPGGCIAEALAAYEHRAGQVDMAREVADALRDGRFLLAEAGTGVGKSLAYLVPAVLWACREGEPVVISTNTKNLQAQLIEKDLPLLQRALPFGFQAALLKGRANYPCIRLLMSVAIDAANSLLRGERVVAAFLISWLAHGSGGDLESLPGDVFQLLPELPSVLARVRSQGDSCVGKACSYGDVCPVEIARAHARNSDIIVANHALTMADARSQVLPKYSRLVFDEAQNVETVATDALSLECSGHGLRQLLQAFSGSRGSFVEMIKRRLLELGERPGVPEANGALDQLPALADTFADAAAEMGDLVFDFCFDMPNDGRTEEGRAAVRLTDEVRQMPEWAELAELGAQALSAGLTLLRSVEAFAEQLKPIDKGAKSGSEGLDTDADAVKMRIAAVLEALAKVLDSGSSQVDYVTWAEAWRSRSGPSWGLHAAPVDIGPVLEEALFSKKSAIVFTSATMTVDGRFGYFRQRLGLDRYRDKLVEVTASSPFDLTEQLLLCVPGDMPEASQFGFNDAVVDALGKICEVTEGGTLALFTARSRMSQAFRALEQPLRSQGMTPLCQDVSGPRYDLLERLRHDDRAVLFGLKSFWEGVDVPGDALRCVVICKLPFAVPSDPVVQARQEDAARKGLDPMMDYYLPEAVVAFKQGFGRLIRTATDTGVVFVLDKRIVTRGYGRRFFRSIQRCEFARETLEDCLDRARGWLGR